MRVVFSADFYQRFRDGALLDGAWTPGEQLLEALRRQVDDQMFVLLHEKDADLDKEVQCHLAMILEDAAYEID